MKTDFAQAMGRALDATRQGDPGGATRLIQEALGGVKPDAGASRPRRPLGQVVDALAKTRRSRRPSHRGGLRAPVPDGARFEVRRHVAPHGARDLRLFLPSDREASPKGLVLMLHGCTQTAEDFALGTRMNLVAEAQNFAIAYPEQDRGANSLGCWNWFQPGDQSRGAGEPAILADLARSLAEELGLGAARTFAAGLSAGGAMAAILGAEYADVFAGTGVHSGLAPGAARDLPGAYAAMRGEARAASRPAAQPAPLIVFHGTADRTVAVANADAVIAHATAGPGQTIIEAREEPSARVEVHRDGDGRLLAEDWRLPGVAHAWSGGAPEGSHTDPGGPCASTEMLRFFEALIAEAQA